MNYQSFYLGIEKPFFAPEPWVFGFAWGIIYPLIAIAFLYTLYLFWKGSVPRTVLGIFGVNLLANILYTPIQLYVSPFLLATLTIYIVLITLAYLEWRFFKISKIIFVLLLPYLLWGAFATVLQTAISIMNS